MLISRHVRIGAKSWRPNKWPGWRCGYATVDSKSVRKSISEYAATERATEPESKYEHNEREDEPDAARPSLRLAKRTT